MLNKASIALNSEFGIKLHHYGVDNFAETGHCLLIVLIEITVKN